MNAAIRKYENFFFEKSNIFYDLQSCLYSTRALVPDGNFPKVLPNGEMLCNFIIAGENGGPGPDMQYFLDEVDQILPYFSQFVEVGLLLKKVVRESELTTGNNKIALEADIATFDRSNLNFLELVVSQYPLFSPDHFVSFPKGRLYLMKPEQHIDPNYVTRCNEFSGTKYVGPGLKKAIKYVEGPSGRGRSNTALVIARMFFVFKLQIYMNFSP